MSEPSDGPEDPFDLLHPLDDHSGPARPLSPERASALIQGALDAALPPGPKAPLPRPRPDFRLAGIAGASVVVVGALALGLWWARQPPPPAPPVPHEAPATPAPPAVPPVEVPPSAGVMPPPAVEAPPAPVPEVRPPPRPAAEPEDLLRRANERRAEGQWQTAEGLYQRVLQSSPGTESAYVALVASGGLRLEHLEDAKGALRQYQQALRMRPRGALSEEAHHGVARAWRALGDTAQEKRALEEFLSAHPDSLRAESARRRLGELTGP